MSGSKKIQKRDFFFMLKIIHRRYSKYLEFQDTSFFALKYLYPEILLSDFLFFCLGPRMDAHHLCQYETETYMVCSGQSKATDSSYLLGMICTVFPYAASNAAVLYSLLNLCYV